jgi:GNAT superfamily N-acetyltransferase
MKPLMIRQATSSDLDLLTTLIRLFPAPTVPDEGYIRSCFIALLSDPKAYLAVAVDHDGTVVGYLSGYRHAAFYAGGETAWCDEVFVKEDQRRRGVGKQLMQAFEQWAGQNRCVLVSLATAGAKGFYESLGYATRASYFKKYLSGKP